MLSPFPPKATLSPLSVFLMHAQLTSSQLQQAHGRLGRHRSRVEIINPSLTVNVSLVKGLTLTACSNHQHVFSWIHLYPSQLLYTHTALAKHKKMCILIQNDKLNFLNTHNSVRKKIPQQRIIIPLYQKQIEVIHHTCEMQSLYKNVKNGRWLGKTLKMC